MLAGLARWIGFLTMATLTAGLVLLVCGFIWFFFQIPTEEVQLDRKADGIVVLTGAAARLPDGLQLLAADPAKRLLISGVFRNTRSAEIARLKPLYSKYFSC